MYKYQIYLQKHWLFSASGWILKFQIDLILVLIYLQSFLYLWNSLQKHRWVTIIVHRNIEYSWYEYWIQYSYLGYIACVCKFFETLT